MEFEKYRVMEEDTREEDTRINVEYMLNRADEEGYDLVQVVGVGVRDALNNRFQAGPS